MFTGRDERIVATIEARMTSSRLPGKVLLPIGGVPALQFQIERLKRSRYLDAICVATTTNAADEPIVRLAEALRVDVFRGSETDVLGRVLGAAQSVRADVIVEITGDCPFADPALVDRGIEEFFSHDVDYASNTIEATYANGFDVQVFPTRVLAEVAARTEDPIDRTHVSYYIYTHPNEFRCHNWTADEKSHSPDLRVTLDEQADYDVLTKLAAALPHDASAADVVQYLRTHPGIVDINKDVRQKDVHEL
jgi:spore coat polysaccharide biosynthesis protein SpsF